MIVHRAILGSVERMFAILCEHTAGKWPFWLSPRQVAILPIKDSNLEYARKIENRLIYEGFECEVNDVNGTFKNKIRVAEKAQFNYMVTLGDIEQEQGLVDVRARGMKQMGKMTVDDFVAFLHTLAPKNSIAEDEMQ